MLRRRLAVILLMSAACAASIAHAETAPCASTCEWVATYDGSVEPPKNDNARAVGLDGQGSIYVAGNSFVSSSTQQMTTVKYDPAGNQLWTSSYASSFSYAQDIAVDPAGNAHVLGYEDAGGNPDGIIVVAKYDAAGNELWSETYDGTVPKTPDQPSAIAVDAAGNVYVAGSVVVDIVPIITTFVYDAVLVKYDADGNLVWDVAYDAGGDSDNAFALAMDGSGNVYLGGRSEPATGHVAILGRYDSLGGELWTIEEEDVEAFEKLAVDANGDVYAMSREGVTKYSSAGAEVWSTGFHTEADGRQAVGLALDEQGGILVAGSSSPTPSDPGDARTERYSQATGTRIWGRSYVGADGLSDIGVAVVTNAGAAFVAGNTYTTSNSWDVLTLRYRMTDGLPIWVHQYDGPASSDDLAADVALGPGTVAVVGQAYLPSSPSDTSDLLTIAFGNTVGGVTELSVGADGSSGTPTTAIAAAVAAALAMGAAAFAFRRQRPVL